MYYWFDEKPDRKETNSPMAGIPQSELFSWDRLEASSDLRRFELLLSALPDEELMAALEEERKGRRDDYPLRAVWNSILAGVVFQHPSNEALRRELLRNAELRQVRGFSPLKGGWAVPPKYVYSRFLSKLFKHQEKIDAMFDGLVERLRGLPPGFGTDLAIDSKALSTWAKSKKDPDKRGDPEADWGTKTYRGIREDGTTWEKIKSWFGYKVYLIVDADYELPVAYGVTRAGQSDTTYLLPMVEKLKENHAELAQEAQTLSGDKGFDSEENIKTLWDEYEIKPAIALIHKWKEAPEAPRSSDPDRVDTLFYNQDGHLLCRHLDTPDETKNYAPMAFEGFEHSRQSLKYRCPAQALGITCTQRAFCNDGQHTAHGRIVRIPLEKDRRLFTPLARGTYAWERVYKKRTSVERVNSRLDVSFGFERHFIRGKRKMRARMGLALAVMLGMAVGWIEAGEKEKMRSLVQPRAA
jgi:hypothetical protein